MSQPMNAARTDLGGSAVPVLWRGGEDLQEYSTVYSVGRSNRISHASALYIRSFDACRLCDCAIDTAPQHSGILKPCKGEVPLGTSFFEHYLVVRSAAGEGTMNLLLLRQVREPSHIVLYLGVRAKVSKVAATTSTVRSEWHSSLLIPPCVHVGCFVFQMIIASSRPGSFPSSSRPAFPVRFAKSSLDCAASSRGTSSSS